MDHTSIDYSRSSISNCGSRNVIWMFAVGILVLNGLALSFTWFSDILTVQRSAAFNLLGLRIPLFSETNTFSILQSLTVFYQDGQLTLFVLVGVFAVLVPAVKLLFSAGLIVFNFGVQAHRWIAAMQVIGRWAMTDIFVVAILVATLKLGESVEIIIRPGFYWFIAAAILPMVNTKLISNLYPIPNPNKNLSKT